MIQQKQGNILQVKEGVILHQVNCQGVMGSGIAKHIKELYPEVYHNYLALCNSAFFELGTAQPVHVTTELTIINIFGQKFYGKDGSRYTSYDALDRAFEAVAEVHCSNKIYDIHFPRLGCGLGGGKWSIVSSIIETYLSKHNLYLWDL